MAQGQAPDDASRPAPARPSVRVALAIRRCPALFQDRPSEATASLPSGGEQAASWTGLNEKTTRSLIMSIRFKRPLAVAAATLLGGAAVVAVAATPAVAAEYCYNQAVTITITSSGSYNGTAGNDVVWINSPSGRTYYDPVGGRDRICAHTAGGVITIWANGSGHWIIGTHQGDTIYGSEGSDTISGEGGNDVIKGNGGNDFLDGYGGDDYIRGNAGDDIIDGGQDDDCLVGGTGYNRIYGSFDHDTLLLGHDSRYSSAQCAPAINDTSSAATAFMNSVSSGGGQANGDNGNDRIWGTNGSDSATGGAGNDTISTFGGNDGLYGDTGADYLNAGYGNDSIYDWYPDSVADFAYGGPGTDYFSVTSGGGDVCYAEWGPGTVSCSGGQG
jgi:Ca2+-binding RTX toxin-like protein